MILKKISNSLRILAAYIICQTWFFKYLKLYSSYLLNVKVDIVENISCKQN